VILTSFTLRKIVAIKVRRVNYSPSFQLYLAIFLGMLLSEKGKEQDSTVYFLKLRKFVE
jgi:hypothetical protein